MRNRLAGVVLLILMPIAAFAAAKENIEIKVVSSKTKIHGSSDKGVFSYTFLMFAQVSGKNVLYVCDQKGDICPPMESGKTYMAEKDGDAIYIAMSVVEEKKPIRVKYKESGAW